MASLKPHSDPKISESKVVELMADDAKAPPMRLVNFVSQEELEEVKKTRGERVEDGTAQRDRPLFEILKENKDKKDAEFNERFKHRPPKALDEDETEFLEKLETSRKEYERQVADEEESELQRFQAAVAAQSMVVHEIKEPTPSISEEPQPRVTKKASSRPSGFMIKVKPQAKKAKLEPPSSGKPKDDGGVLQAPKTAKTTTEADAVRSLQSVDKTGKSDGSTLIGLVSYSDESDED